MVSITINPSGAIRKNMFSRADEYAFFVFLGDAYVVQQQGEGDEIEVRWWYLRRLEYGSRRGTVKGGTAQFYPIYIDNIANKIVHIGEALPHTQDRNTITQIEGTTAVFPIRDDGTEMNWGVTGDTLKRLIKKKVIQVLPNKKSAYQPFTIKYLSENFEEKIESGRWAVRGYREDGSKIVVETGGKLKRATTVWQETKYDAKTYGTVILKNIIGGSKFAFPKSLYAVKDSIKYFVANKPNAIILDFFAGSGTTLHAINLLNSEDGGHRKCIMVTNNEVSADEAKNLSSKGYYPGDKEWEQLGIARYVTWPRTVCSIEGHDVNGKPLKGNYIGSDAPMADGFKANAAFFKLGFLDKTSVALGRQLAELIPVLWLKAGSIGPCPELADLNNSMLILPENQMAILIDEKQYQVFYEEVQSYPEIQTIYIITDSEAGYREMIAGFDGKDTYQLYRDYLDNFRINTGR